MGGGGGGGRWIPQPPSSFRDFDRVLGFLFIVFLDVETFRC